MEKLLNQDTNEQQRLPTVILLCAGRSERFKALGGKGSKLDAKLGELSVKEHALECVHTSGLPVVIVEPKDLAHLSEPGMGDSIAHGVAQSIQKGLDNPSLLPSGWLILPGDMPLIESATLRLVAEQLLAAEQREIKLSQHPMKSARLTLAPVYQGQRGHPVGFTKAFLKNLLSLKGDSGAKEILQAYPPQLVNVQDRGCVFDVDTPALLEEAQAWLNSNPKPQIQP